jgi:creatinine amidohydrolase/Fe(II)-dependent formamide hydrolase-like protein/AcrR family transcriptional regulator
MRHLWEELTSAQLADRMTADPDCVALIPVGATEQHGPHLPVGTDTIIATALADAAAGEVAVVLPPLPFGASFFHSSRMAGTVAFTGEETAATAGLVAEACVDSGFRRLLFVNGHIGNVAALWIACDRLRWDFPDLRIGVMQWWDLTPDIARRATDDAADWHANAAETSLMLVLRPNSSTPTRCATPTILTAPRAPSSATPSSMCPPTGSPDTRRARRSRWGSSCGGTSSPRHVISSSAPTKRSRRLAKLQAIGRPRNNTATAPTTSPRADIVNAATRLFSEKGYAQTAMSDIARASGLQQSSLYYWFRNKEQLLGETLLVNRAPLTFIAEVGAGSGSPAVKLYRLLRFDTMQLALSPIDFNEIQRIAHDQRTEFQQFWTDYERLKDWVVDLIGAAISEGKFIDCDREETAGLLLNFDEGAQKRTRLHTGQGDRAEEAIRVGEQVAIIAVRGLLKRPSEIAGISAAAAQFDDAAIALRVSRPQPE